MAASWIPNKTQPEEHKCPWKRPNNFLYHEAKEMKHIPKKGPLKTDIL